MKSSVTFSVAVGKAQAPDVLPVAIIQHHRQRAVGIVHVARRRPPSVFLARLPSPSTNIAELTLGLHPEVESATPLLVFRVQNSLNAAYCTFIAHLLMDSNLSQPFRQAGHGTIGDQLAELVWNNRFAEHRADRRDAEA